MPNFVQIDQEISIVLVEIYLRPSVKYDSHWANSNEKKAR